MSLTRGRAVLAFDELVCRHPDRLAELRARDNTPRWLRDQIDAARTQVDTGLRAVAQLHGKHLRELPAREHPDWVRLGLLDALFCWLDGDADTCIHQPHPMRPEPITAAAWKPGLVVCGHCTHLLRLPRRSRADRTCDGCGHVNDADDGIFPLLLVGGPFTYACGVCRDCRYWTED